MNKRTIDRTLRDHMTRNARFRDARLVVFAVVGSALMNAGCATIFHGSTETLHIDSNPRGAYVIENDHVLGRTPMSVELDSGRGHALQLRAAGYQDAWIALGVEPLICFYVLDVLLTLGIGLYVDAATGSITTFDKEAVRVDMARLGAPTTHQGYALPPGMPPPQQVPAPPAEAPTPAGLPPATAPL